MRRTRARRLLLATTLAGLALAALAASQAVDVAVTDEDRDALGRILPPGLRARDAARSLGDELETIRGVQAAILAAAPANRGLPAGQPREPAQLVAAGHGLCYDRSRAIEKALALLGFETRHVFVYAEERGPVVSLLAPGTPSHAVSEVRTRAGWMVVDSNLPWMALDADGAPHDIGRVRAAVGRAPRWAPGLGEHFHPIYQRPFRAVYGLYSRHGKFYPPYLPFPDLHWGQLADNLR